MTPVLLIIAVAIQIHGIAGVTDVVASKQKANQFCQYDAFTSSKPIGSKVYLIPYRKADRKADWYEARGYCADNCADMATIQSTEENAHLFDFVRGVGKSGFWLGAQVVDRSDFTTWTNGETALFQNKKTAAGEYNENGLTCLNVYDINQLNWYNDNCDSTAFLIVCQRSSNWTVCE